MVNVKVKMVFVIEDNKDDSRVDEKLEEGSTLALGNKPTVNDVLATKKVKDFLKRCGVGSLNTFEKDGAETSWRFKGAKGQVMLVVVEDQNHREFKYLDSPVGALVNIRVKQYYSRKSGRLPVPGNLSARRMLKSPPGGGSPGESDSSHF